ncbi:alpha/beta fold hydrolase [Microbispora sp. NPDC049125]|uniref:alpha/beta fold hydrolase n=1 Tax=Microbispora sp. NPDC049125 TaxID=3154929 RepID=UPI0034655D3C
MRQASGRNVGVNGRNVYVEESGTGSEWVVFEAGQGCGRTCWDALLPLLHDQARLVAYDRAGFGRSGRVAGDLSIDDMAADLVQMVETVVPGKLVLVAHSMGGLVARRAAESLSSRLSGLLLIDPTPETAPVYDTWDRTTAKIDKGLAVAQVLTRFRPFRRLASGNMRRLFPPDTYEAMLAENLTPAGIAQTRSEVKAVAAAIPRFRARPPALPRCEALVLSAGHTPKGKAEIYTGIREHQRRYAESLPDGRCEVIDSGHFIQAEQPHVVAAALGRLLRPHADTRTHGPGQDFG